MKIRSRVLPFGWYPSSSREIQNQLQSYTAAVPPLSPGVKVYGGVMPHAGWYFSGRLAAQVFYLAARQHQPQVVCLFGGHLQGSAPPLLVMDDAWETPLGPVPLATELYEPLQEQIPCAPEEPGDNTLEIQLPMIKYFFPQAKVLALRAPQSQTAIRLGEAVAAVARKKGLSLLAFGSADLTHYGPNYGWAPQGYGAQAVTWVKEVNDKKLVDQALHMAAPEVLRVGTQDHSSCSAGAIAAAISAARALGAKKGHLVDYYTSYDIMPGDSFVGYVGLLFIS